MTYPLISVVIPVYNGGTYLTKALQSVITQSYKNIEIIIVNDGSTDTTADIILDWKKKHARIISLLHEKNLGFVASLNDGISVSKGKYIARLDADDVWLDEKKIEKQVDFLEKNLEYVLVGGGVVIMGEKNGKEINRYLFPEQDAEIRKFLLCHNLFSHSAVVFLKSAFLESGGYNKRFGFFCDADLWLKLCLKGKCYNFQEYFTGYLDKEYDTASYTARDNQIRRRLILRIQMKWGYRKSYPGIVKAIVLSMGSFVYSFIPFKIKVKPILFTLRTKLFGSPYRY